MGIRGRVVQLVSAMALVFVGCDTSSSPDGGPQGRDAATPDESIDAGDVRDADARDAGPPSCPQFAAAVNAGEVAQAALREASGIVASHRNPGVLWAHNDSGDSPRLFALGADGAALGVYSVNGAQARDWEDIAAGSSAEGGHLYIGDIGDNRQTRASITIYRVLEPAVDPSAPADGALAAERMEVTYEDRARNSETLFYDPDTDSLFTVHKTGNTQARIYRIGPFVPDGEVTATVVGMVETPIATGGDISPDGREIVIRSYGGVRLWQRPPSVTLAEALGATHCEVPSHGEPQGEAIAFALDGSGYFTLSERQSQPLWFFARE